MKKDFYALYRECFPEDSERCTEAVFERLNASKRMQVVEDGELRSALYLVEKQLFYCGKTVKIPHIVGLGTFEKDRKKGYAERLILMTLRSLDSPFITLYPFKHSFYEKYGFSTVSFDFEEPADGEETTVSEAEKSYKKLCENLDYYFVREKEDFEFYERVFAADGEGYVKCKGGIKSPDGYIPEKYFLTERKGVMARVINLEKALSLTDISSDISVKVVDKTIPSNNIIFRLDCGKIVRCKKEDVTVDISEMTKALFGKSDILSDIFPKKDGYLADKY